MIGELKGLKFLIEITSKTLDTDIKSIKKAARKGVEKELIKRVDEILKSGEVKMSDQGKIIWMALSLNLHKKHHPIKGKHRGVFLLCFLS